MRTPDAAELLAAINRWVAIESKSDDLAGVTAMIDAAAAAFAAAGMAVERIAGRDGFGDHLRAGAPWGGAHPESSPGVLVLCHLDTVHPRGTLAANPIRTEGDRAYGPGICDMKGGVVIALAAAGSLIGTGRVTPLPLRFLVTSDEEVGSPTSRALIEAEGARAKYVLVVEPAREGGKCVTARKGTGRMTVTAHGVPAHSGLHHRDGASAILEIARQVVALEAMTDYARGLTVNVGLIRGGTGVNVVPEHCAVEVDLRMVTPEDGEAAAARVRGLTPRDPRVRLEVSGGLNRPPYRKSAEITALYGRARGLAAEIGFELGDTFTGGGSDGNFTAALAPTLDGLGVDGAGAHTLGEHLLVSSLVPRMTLLRRLFETLD
ncbi:MAG TPA: M20 family metallopeptidase [Thermohalobaculum sp.]|nr:M20 family metallopeptidase [Thermohalobaculum sp.]